LTDQTNPAQVAAEAETSSASRGRRGSVGVQAVLVLAAVLAGTLTYWLMPESMEPGARRMASIFAVAVVLWVTEAIPLFATSLVVIALEAWWVAIPRGVAGDLSYTVVFNSLSNPIIFLFLGGFILAKAVQKERIDIQMAALLLRAFGNRPAAVLAGMMLITALFSMWMSNTATTAMMIVMVQPLLTGLKERDRFRKALVLSVPFAANIGGIGTPIGTPPNAIALAQLEALGMPVSFLGWMSFAVPLMLLSLAVLWFSLLTIYRPRTGRLEVAIEEVFRLTPKAMVVYATFAVTVVLWLTGSWHGVPTAVVAILPAAALTVARVIGKDDFNTLEWNILILIAGGIALGEGFSRTGLDQWIVRLIPAQGLNFYLLAALFGAVTIALSSVISNSVATLLLLPIGLAMAQSLGGTSTQIQVFAAMCALTASYAMSLPISTPPNAIAYGTGQIESRDMLLVGGVAGVAATLLVVTTGPIVIGWFLGLGL
jgi:sodium-dependent dicarboxylate transporter 2/3/5